MLWTYYKLSLLFIPVIGIFIYLAIHYTTFIVCFVLVSIGLIYGLILAIHQSKPYTILSSAKSKKKSNATVKWIVEQIQISSKQNPTDSAVTKHDIHIDLKTIIDQICDLLLENFVLFWFRTVSYEQTTFTQAFKDEIHSIVANIKTRCTQVDWVKVISNDLVVQFSEHYQQIRRATLHPTTHPFRLYAHLQTDETENEFLRAMSEALLFLVLPNSYSSTLPVRHLLREVFAFKVFKPTIDLICEPNYLNETILYRIEQLNLNNEQKSKKFTLASNYENFIDLIQTNNDLGKLEQFWNSIVIEIMQATAIRSLLKEGVISRDNHQARLGTKGELLINRDLTKYINQLRQAKIICEKCMIANGGRSYLIVDASTNKDNLANRKILSLKMILSSKLGRNHFQEFLATFGTQTLVKFWYDVWKLRSAAPNELHRVATNIYKTYITRFGSAVRDEIDDSTVMRMKSFLVAEQAEPDAFYQGQSVVYQVLQRDYYASFLVSKHYDSLCRAFDPAHLQDFDLKEELLGWTTPALAGETDDETIETGPSQHTGSISEEPSENVPKHLADLRRQLENKRYALAAAKEASTFDATVLQSLERDCANLNQEISALECLLENVDVWWSYMGEWQARILSNTESHQLSSIAVLIQSPCDRQVQVGWVINRKLNTWYHFYMRLKDLEPSLPTIDLFRKHHYDFNRFQYDESKFAQLCNQLQLFLQTILRNEHTSSFEVVYQFLNPSIADDDNHISNIIQTKKKHIHSKKNKSDFTELFRSDKLINDLFETDSMRFLEGRVDSIAKPFYTFIDVLFDEQAILLKLIRTTLVQFIRVTYGSTINRQVRRSIVSLFHEEYVVKYLTMLRDTVWPKDPSVSRPAPTDDEKRERRQKAKQQLLTNIPETISMIFGSDNAKSGAERLFELFQDSRANKHLCYKLILLFLTEIFPELQLKL